MVSNLVEGAVTPLGELEIGKSKNMLFTWRESSGEKY